jgi:hypothetical protein
MPSYLGIWVAGQCGEAAGDLPVLLPGRFRFADPQW